MVRVCRCKPIYFFTLKFLKMSTLTTAPTYKTGQPILETIKIVRMDDETPDLSYLDQFADSNDPDEQQYYRQDQQRKDSYGSSWWCVGFKAEADILIPSADGKSYQCITVQSAGLWGIDSDSCDEYFKEVAEGEMYELRHVLKALNVWTGGNVTLFKGSKGEKQILNIEQLERLALKAE